MRAHYIVFNKAAAARPDCRESAEVDDNDAVFFQLCKPLYARCVETILDDDMAHSLSSPRAIGHDI